jgi:hypothetical protein
MATELFSLWGCQTGWRAQHGDGYDLSAELDGFDIWYCAKDNKTVEQAFHRACRRTFLRRFLPWLEPPPAVLPTNRTPTPDTMTVPSERTRAIIETRHFLEELVNKRLTPDVPEEIRNQARALLRHYPFGGEIHLAHRVLPEWFGPVQTRKY